MIILIVLLVSSRKYNKPFLKYKGTQEYLDTYALALKVIAENIGNFTVGKTLFEGQSYEEAMSTIKIYYNNINVTTKKPNAYLEKYQKYKISFKYNLFTWKINQVFIENI